MIFWFIVKKSWMSHMRTRAVTHDLIDHIWEGFLCQLLHYILDGESFGWQWVPLGSLNSHTALSMCEMFWQWAAVVMYSIVSLPCLSCTVHFVHSQGVSINYWTGLLSWDIFGFYTPCGWFNRFLLAKGTCNPALKWWIRAVEWV